MKIYGDAVRETSTAGTGDTSWQNNKSNFGGLYFPFMVRDGSLWDGLHSGRFYFTHNSGDSTFNNGFRPVVIPIS